MLRKDDKPAVGLNTAYIFFGLLCLILLFVGNWSTMPWIGNYGSSPNWDWNFFPMFSECLVSSTAPPVVPPQPQVPTRFPTFHPNMPPSTPTPAPFFLFGRRELVQEKQQQEQRRDLQWTPTFPTRRPTYPTPYPTPQLNCAKATSNFVGAMFIFSAVAQMAALIVSICLHYELYCKAPVKKMLLACLYLSAIGTFCGLLTWSIVLGEGNKSGNYASTGLNVYFAYWGSEVVCLILISASYLTYKKKEEEAAQVVQIPETDMFFHIGVQFTSYSAAASWGCIVGCMVYFNYAPITNALGAFSIIILLLQTSFAIALIPAIFTPQKKTYILAGVAVNASTLVMAIICLGLSIGSSVGGFSIFTGYILGLIVCTSVALAMFSIVFTRVRALANNVPTLTSTKTYGTRNPKKTMDMLISAVVFNLLTMCLAFSSIYSVVLFTYNFYTGKRYYETHYDGGIGLFTGLSWPGTVVSFLLSCMACLDNSPIRTSTGLLSSWLIQLVNFICFIVVCALTGNGFAIAGVITSFIGLVLTAIVWDEVRLLDNPRKGNVCTVYGQPCCPEGIAENKGCCAPGQACYSAQSFNGGFFDKKPTTADGAAAAGDEEAQPTPISSSSAAAAVPQTSVDPEVIKIRKEIELAKLNLELMKLKKEQNEIAQSLTAV